ncbi:Glutamate decarboxylase [Bacteroides xylanisolvens SD CC 1b]|uniref:Glutamate decarboxylase n=1 Tax=Bacteroides xylanisolvens SD CC 1b TaxID=702447 RepID=D4VKR7_9BACE|nr:conserved domain protein [Bacteroides xylanisolvens SD CC 1b]CDM06669.1 Glutamate decarboxylase [Bacteroides xylanisolvens SD CC 1b]
MLQPSPVEKIPDGPTTPEVAYQMVKDETFAQTQPRLNLATFVTTYMDEYATKLMNEAININYIDETEYPRIAVMNGKCINIVANLWNSPEKRYLENRCFGYRFFRSMYVGWCSCLVALAQEKTSTGQTV